MNSNQNNVRKLLKKKRIIIGGSILLVVSVLIGIIANTIFLKKGKANTPSLEYSEEYAEMKRDTVFTIDSGGDLEINRNRVEDKSEDLADAWTVLVYMTGADLESDIGAPTKIMNDMASAGVKPDNIKNLNLIVETGGATRWTSNYGSSSNLHRLKLSEGGKFEEVEKLPIASMGDPNTLADFIQWGITNYPAKNTMLILWNHGSPQNDLCYDEIYDDDALMINEVEYALAKSKESLSAPFDILLTHTCSNGTVEFANAVAPYVDFMITTPTYTPTYGFNYKRLVNKLLEEPSEETTPSKVCYTVLDGFSSWANAQSAESAGMYALMTYDLTKLDDFLIEFNKICKKVYEMSAVDRKSAKKINKVIKVTSQYNMETNFDIACYLDSLSENVGIDTSKCLELLDEVVVRYIRCSYINKTCLGMAMYHPVGGMSIQEFNLYRNKAVSPYYLMYLERSAHLIGKRDFDNFKDYDWKTSKFFHEETFDFLNYTQQRHGNKISNENMYTILCSNPAYASDGFVDNWNNNLKEVPLEERREFTDIEIAVTEDTFTGTITQNPEEVYKVYNTVFADVNERLMCLGEDASATYDETTGEIKSNFKGEWLMLGDGQLLTTYYKTKIKDYDAGNGAKEYDQYTIPVVIDDKEATIYFMKNDEELIIQYVAYEKKDGINSGYMEELRSGMRFTPIYDVWDEETKTYTTEYGEEYTYKGNEDFLYTTLSDAEYSYAFIIEDVSGDKSYSKEHGFSVMESEVTLTAE